MLRTAVGLAATPQLRQIYPGSIATAASFPVFANEYNISGCYPEP